MSTTCNRHPSGASRETLGRVQGELIGELSTRSELDLIEARISPEDGEIRLTISDAELDNLETGEVWPASPPA